MHYLNQICKVTIAMFLIAVVAVLFSTLTGCRGCSSSEEEVVRWIPASRDTIPETIIEDSLDIEPVIEELITVAKPAKKRQPVSEKKPDSEEVVGDCPQENTDVHLWSDEFDLDSITLTIITSEVEMEITQNLN